MSTRVPDRRLEVLRSVSRFRGLDDRALGRIDGLIDDLIVAEGTTICREGEVGRESFIVADGWAEVVIGGNRMCTLGPGSFFGELAMLDHQPRTATVKAITGMHLLVVGPSAFSSLLSEPQLSARMLLEMATRLRKADAASISTS